MLQSRLLTIRLPSKQCQYKIIPSITLKPLLEAYEQKREQDITVVLSDSVEGIRFSIQCVY
jgi:hypothetical protein